MSLQKITMSSGGAYSLATRGAEDVINVASQLVKNAFSEMDIPPDQKAFTFSDMGCADGGTSLKMIEEFIKFLRLKNPQISFRIIYNDQPKNDYNGLVQTVLGLGHFPSYLENHNDVHPFF